MTATPAPMSATTASTLRSVMPATPTPMTGVGLDKCGVAGGTKEGP